MARQQLDKSSFYKSINDALTSSEAARWEPLATARLPRGSIWMSPVRNCAPAKQPGRASSSLAAASGHAASATAAMAQLKVLRSNALCIQTSSSSPASASAEGSNCHRHYHFHYDPLETCRQPTHAAGSHASIYTNKAFEQ